MATPQKAPTASEGHLEIVQPLFDHGADPNTRRESRSTPVAPPGCALCNAGRPHLLWASTFAAYSRSSLTTIICLSYKVLLDAVFPRESNVLGFAPWSKNNRERQRLLDMPPSKLTHPFRSALCQGKPIHLQALVDRGGLNLFPYYRTLHHVVNAMLGKVVA